LSVIVRDLLDAWVINLRESENADDRWIDRRCPGVYGIPDKPGKLSSTEFPKEHTVSQYVPISADIQ
jgi:hypothetical protein